MIPENLLQRKKVEHKPSGYSLVTCCSFDKLKNEWSYHRGKDYMEMYVKI